MCFTVKLQATGRGGRGEPNRPILLRHGSHRKSTARTNEGGEKTVAGRILFDFKHVTWAVLHAFHSELLILCPCYAGARNGNVVRNRGEIPTAQSNHDDLEIKQPIFNGYLVKQQVFMFWDI